MTMIFSRNVRLAALAAFTAALLPMSSALADGGSVSPVTNPLAKEECAACHMAFPAGFLPAASWNRIMSTLGDHFGEDASLSDAATEEIRAYLAANASRSTRGIDLANPPLRISELSWFTHEHGSRLRARAESTPEISSIANCTACHRGAERGYFDDD